MSQYTDWVRERAKTQLLRPLIEELVNLAKRSHYYCDDPWYTCPLHEDGCANDNLPYECNCGAEKHNQQVEELKIKLMDLLNV